MKLNTQQQQWLKDYLGAVFTYREIYEEVYDHIALELESRPLQVFFEANVHQVIDDEFGGLNALMVLEEKCKDSIVAQTRGKYNSYFKWLKFPAILIVITALITVFYTIMRVKHLFSMFMPALIVHVFGYFLLIPIVSVFIPFLLLAVKYFQASRRFGNGSVSAQDEVFKKLSFLPFKVLVYIIIFNRIFYYLYYLAIHLIPRGDNWNINPFLHGIFAISNYLLFVWVLTLPVLHLFAFYKIYRSKFKVIGYYK